MGDSRDCLDGVQRLGTQAREGQRPVWREAAAVVVVVGAAVVVVEYELADRG